MKKNTLVKDLLSPALVLLVIAAVCTALLAFTNQLTKDKIKAINTENENKAKAAVFTDAKTFSGAKTVSSGGADQIYYEAADSTGKLLGYVFPMTVKSYGGNLSCMVGISLKDSRVTGVKITDINDTAGLGMKAKEPNFLAQFVHKAEGVLVNKTKKSDTEIQAITGATITSKAVTGAVNGAFEAYDQLKAGGSNG